MFGSKGIVHGTVYMSPWCGHFKCSGVVYVTDKDNDHVQLFSADGQFISSFGNEGS